MKARFYYCHDEWLRNGFSRYGLFFSEAFCHFFSEKMEQLFFTSTGLKPSSKVTLAGYKQPNDLPIYQSGLVSKLNLVLWIMPEYNDNISFCWQSKSGKIIKPTDENFDESDLTCWIEGLNPDVYFQQLNSVSTDHPLKLNNLPYTLIVKGFGMHMGLEITLTDISLGEMIIHQLSEVAQKHNDVSEAKGRVNGVVHHCEGAVVEGMVRFRIDVGSAGVVFIRKLLKTLAKYPEVKEVVVDL
jgi:hypothetical protein